MRLVITFLTDRPILFQCNELRCSLGRDSSNLNDHINTITANTGGVRNTICQEKKDIMAIPRNGA